jgi:hypothetical protein
MSRDKLIKEIAEIVRGHGCCADSTAEKILDLIERSEPKGENKEFNNADYLKAQIGATKKMIDQCEQHGDLVGKMQYIQLLSSLEFELRKPFRVGSAQKRTLANFGSAPGDYQLTCVHCSKIFVGASKAVSCKPCAEFYLNNDEENYAE